MVAYYQRVLKDHLPGTREAKVLDVGCGMGFAMLALRETGFTSVQGVETDEGQATSCKDKGLDVVLTQDTGAFLKTKPSFYQLILALDLIEHIPVREQLEFVSAMSAALVPGGKLICTVPNANSILAARYRYICWTHQCSFTEHSLDFLLYNAGFCEIKVMEVESIQRPAHCWWPRGGVRHWWAFRFFRLWRRLEMMAELGPQQGRAVPLSLNLLAIAHKP